MAKNRPRQLVIDADIAHSAGVSTVGASQACSKFLTAVQDHGHLLALTDQLLAEWQRHQSRFATTWLRDMSAADRVVVLDVTKGETFRSRIAEAAPETSVAAIMLKDCHLIEAARAAERRIISMDERVCGHFRRAAGKVQELRRVCWVNPARADEQPIPWLRRGAPLNRHRLLGAAAR